MASLTSSTNISFKVSETEQAQAQTIFDAQRQAIYVRTDRLFAGLMALQWAGVVLAACVLSPRTWAGTASQVHPHIWAALFLGGLLSVFPICLALLRPGRVLTRHVIAVSQLLMSALLIHVTGGRLATHFHIFGSLAFLAFYRDWRVIASATLVTGADHLLRGIFWPQSVYGLAAASPWLTAEHVGWVAFEDVFLLISCRQSLHEMYQISLRQSQLEGAEQRLTHANETLETQVEQRTAALAQMQRQNKLLLDSAGEGIYGLDKNGVTQFANPAAARMLGYEVSELIGQPMHPLLHHSHSDGGIYPVDECPIYNCIHTGQACQNVEEVFWHKDGTAVDVEYTGTPLFEDGCLIGAVVTFQCITGRKQSMEALRQSEERLRTLVENAPILLFSYDAQGVLTLIEGSALNQIKDAPGMKIGNSVFDAYRNRPEVIENARRVLSGESVHVTRQMGPMTFDVRLQPLRDAQGSVTGAIGVATDITQQACAEQKIHQLHADLTEAYNAALNAYDATIEGWSRALDLRDHETEGHSRRVTEMTLRLARAVGLPESDMVHIKRGALLHDIGKMGVPDAILLKPGPLDDGEWEIMRRHPAFAKELLDPAEFLRPALEIPYSHHEKWDGTGYPQGLRGEQIPLAARLFALVDVWDALTSNRPYRAAWPRERVLDHLQSLAGTHFDPAIVSVFVQMLEANALPEPLSHAPVQRLAA